MTEIKDNIHKGITVKMPDPNNCERLLIRGTGLTMWVPGPPASVQPQGSPVEVTLGGFRISFFPGSTKSDESQKAGAVKTGSWGVDNEKSTLGAPGQNWRGSKRAAVRNNQQLGSRDVGNVKPTGVAPVIQNFQDWRASKRAAVRNNDQLGRKNRKVIDDVFGCSHETLESLWLNAASCIPPETDTGVEASKKKPTGAPEMRGYCPRPKVKTAVTVSPKQDDDNTMDVSPPPAPKQPSYHIPYPVQGNKLFWVIDKNGLMKLPVRDLVGRTGHWSTTRNGEPFFICQGQTMCKSDLALLKSLLEEASGDERSLI